MYILKYKEILQSKICLILDLYKKMDKQLINTIIKGKFDVTFNNSSIEGEFMIKADEIFSSIILKPFLYHSNPKNQ
tara:strand:- start:300 stop:527 length:228 start_codon:yes stop_codon:yes gene_type:complete